MSRMNKSTEITLNLWDEEWVELVHSIATKMELVEHLAINEGTRKDWLKTLRKLYNRVQHAVEAEGIEC